METVTLYFDGGCSPNPGSGYWGAHAKFKNRSYLNGDCRWSAPLGHITNNCAEYLGLIGGLRGLIRKLKREGLSPNEVRLQVKGDSKIVTGQVARRISVRSERLLPLFEIAYALVNKFGSARLSYIPREHNALADSLGKNTYVDEDEHVFHYEVQPTRVDFWLDGSHVRATSDMYSGNDNNCYIDANFLYNLDNGEEYMQCLEKEGPVPILDGQGGASSILGKIKLHCCLEFEDYDYGYVEWQGELNFIVVDNLPSTVHIAVDSATFEIDEEESEEESVDYDEDEDNYYTSDSDYW